MGIKRTSRSIQFEMSYRVMAQVALALVIILFMGASSFFTMRGLLNSTQAIVDHTDNLALAQDMVSMLVRLEIAQKGYIITGEEKGIMHFEAQVEELQRAVNRIQIAAERYPSLKTSSALGKAMDARLDLFRQSIELRRNEGFEAARKFFLTEKGRKASELVRNLLDDIQDRESIELKSAIKDQRERAQMSQVIMLAESFAAFLLIFFTAFRLGAPAELKQHTDAVGAPVTRLRGRK